MIEHLYEDLSVHLYEGEPITKKAPTPPPITYLTQWKIVGNSEVHGNEIWSCGEYNATDGKYHIFIQPLGGNIVDIALTEPLRKIEKIADTIEFPSGTEGKALVTRNLASIDMDGIAWKTYTNSSGYKRQYTTISNIRTPATKDTAPNIICALYEGARYNDLYASGDLDNIMCVSPTKYVFVRDSVYNELSIEEFIRHVDGVKLIYELATPTTELVDAPQIQEADSYSMVISQGGKAVEWSSFETND